MRWPLAMLCAVALALAPGGCGKDTSRPASAGAPSAAPLPEPPPSAAPRAPTVEWRRFGGVEYQVPVGAWANERDSILPGPKGSGGVPGGVDPTVTVGMPGDHAFYVQIEKPIAPVSLEGMKYVVLGNKMAVPSSVVGKATPSGWDLTYDSADAADASSRKVHVIYADIAGGHFQCTYADVNCKDPAVAEAICRSLRPSAAK
jgi:hypothetical protein